MINPNQEDFDDHWLAFWFSTQIRMVLAKSTESSLYKNPWKTFWEASAGMWRDDGWPSRSCLFAVIESRVMWPERPHGQASSLVFCGHPKSLWALSIAIGTGGDLGFKSAAFGLALLVPLLNGRSLASDLWHSVLALQHDEGRYYIQRCFVVVTEIGINKYQGNKAPCSSFVPQNTAMYFVTNPNRRWVCQHVAI